MNYFKKFVTQPQLPFVVFICITCVIFVFGKFYKPIVSQAFIYSGESISSTSMGQLVTSEGTVIKSYRSKQGIQFLTLKGQNGEYGVSFFPSLGKLSFTPREGDLVKVVGLLDTYKNKTQISPLSSKSITKISSEESSLSDSLNPYPIIETSQLSEHMNETVWIKNLRPVSVEKFTSKKGYKMLKFKAIGSGSISVQGVFFEGNWSDQTVDMLSSQKSISMLATITEFRGEVSLNVKQVRWN